MNDEQARTGTDIKATEPVGVSQAFEHSVLCEPTELLTKISAGPETLDQLLDTARRWAEIQGSDTVRLPHLFAAMLGTGAHARWDWLREQKPDTEWLKQKVLLLVPAQSNRRNVEDGTNVSESVERVLERAKHKENRADVSIDGVYKAFFALGGGVVGEQLVKWGIKLPDFK